MTKDEQIAALREALEKIGELYGPIHGHQAEREENCLACIIAKALDATTAAPAQPQGGGDAALYAKVAAADVLVKALNTMAIFRTGHLSSEANAARHAYNALNTAPDARRGAEP